MKRRRKEEESSETALCSGRDEKMDSLAAAKMKATTTVTLFIITFLTAAGWSTVDVNAGDSPYNPDLDHRHGLANGPMNALHRQVTQAVLAGHRLSGLGLDDLYLEDHALRQDGLKARSALRRLRWSGRHLDDLHDLNDLDALVALAHDLDLRLDHDLLRNVHALIVDINKERLGRLEKLYPLDPLEFVQPNVDENSVKAENQQPRQMGDICVTVGISTVFFFAMVLTLRLFWNLERQKKSSRKTRVFHVDDLGGVNNLRG